MDIGFEPIAVQHADGMLLPPVQKLVATIIFALWGKNVNRVLYRPPYMKNPNYFTIGSAFGFFVYIKDICLSFSSVKAQPFNKVLMPNQ